MSVQNNVLAEALKGFVVVEPTVEVDERGADAPHVPVVASVSQNEAINSLRGNSRESRRPQQFADLPLRCLRYVDLATHITLEKESGIICRFTLRDGKSHAVFTLSVVPSNRVRLTCKESTVAFAPIFVVGSEVFQDEIWNMREPHKERSIATRVFQSVLEAIEESMQQRRNERRQVH